MLPRALLEEPTCEREHYLIASTPVPPPQELTQKNIKLTKALADANAMNAELEGMVVAVEAQVRCLRVHSIA